MGVKTLRRLAVLGLMTATTLAATPSAWAKEDGKEWRLLVNRSGELYRGIRPFILRSVEMTPFYQPGVSDLEVIQTFIKISDAGATSLTFNLTGLNDDGTAIDPESWKAIEHIKAESDYRWIPSICRVLGAYEDKSPEFRMNAVKTAAKAFRGEHAALYWIDGPDHEALVKAFQKIAPELLVAAPSGAPVAVIENQVDAQEGKPNLLIGAVPVPESSSINSVLSGDDALEVYEAAIRDPREMEPWNPSSEGLPADEKAEGFTWLFNGKDFDGWNFTGPDKTAWKVEDGEIRWDHTGGGHVRTLHRYDDFILRLEWKLDRKNANSGVFLHAPRANRESKMGFEFQMMGDYGIEPNKNSTGAIYDVLPATSSEVKKPGEWNTVEIRLEGPKLTATLNGVVVQERNFDDYEELKHRKRDGFICLQDHQFPVAFRNIRIKEL